MIKRNLDGVYFRVQRNGKWDNICFSDLTTEEMQNVLVNKNIEWLRQLAIHLGVSLRKVGDEFDIIA